MALTHRIEECYRKAADARRKANAATAPSIRDDVLGLQRRWLLLLQSWERSRQLGRSMIGQSSKQRNPSCRCNYKWPTRGCFSRAEIA
jgi:hypothetical protein